MTPRNLKGFKIMINRNLNALTSDGLRRCVSESSQLYGVDGTQVMEFWEQTNSSQAWSKQHDSQSSIGSAS